MSIATRITRSTTRWFAESAGQDFTRKAFKAGTGPFVLTEAIKDDHITLEKNPDWWGTDASGGKLPLLDKIIIRPISDSNVRLTNIKTGDAQYVNNVSSKDVASVKSDSSVAYKDVSGLSYGSLVTNRKEGFIFNEGRYVKAVTMALDRQELPALHHQPDVVGQCWTRAFNFPGRVCLQLPWRRVARLLDPQLRRRA